MRLTQLMDAVRDECPLRWMSPSPQGIDDIALAGIWDDSRQCVAGGMFVAVSGSTQDGRDYLEAARQSGARVFVVADEADARVDAAIRAGCHVLGASDIREAHARLSFAWHGFPDRQLDLIGVTGTNGKTTTVGLVRQIAHGAGRRAAEIGTLGVARGLSPEREPLANTTPGPLQLAGILRGLVDEGFDTVAMEVSSHAIHQKRVAGMDFRVAVFTNLTQDHLDYHGTMEAYAAVKCGWVEHVAMHQKRCGTAVVNVDDTRGAEMAAFLRSSGAQVLTFSTRRHVMPDLLAERPKATARGMRAIWRLKRALPTDLTIPLVGHFNVQNALAAAGACVAVGIGEGEALRELSFAAPPPGRFEAIDAGQPYVALVDYAHTPDALENLLSNARQLVASPSEPADPELPRREPSPRLLVLFGAGGNRDRTKRPLMGRIAAEMADVVILTSDNPRHEAPGQIVRDILDGIGEESRSEERLKIEVNRAAAIRLAVRMARRGDVLVLAGKGAEDYQEIAGVRHPFDDRTELRAAIAEYQEELKR